MGEKNHWYILYYQKLVKFVKALDIMLNEFEYSGENTMGDIILINQDHGSCLLRIDVWMILRTGSIQSWFDLR